MKSTLFRYAQKLGLPESGVALAVLMGMGWSTSAAGTQPLTPRDLTGIQSVSTVRISPDGSHIALTKSVPRDPYQERGKHDGEYEDGSPFTELHVIRLSDGRDMPFVTGRKSVGSIEWSPDGAGISFLAKRDDDEHRSLYVIPLEGGEARGVLAHETDISGYSWSPDGRRVAFLSQDKKPKQGEQLGKMGFQAEVYEENLRFTRLWIADIEDEGAELRMLDLEGNVSEPHWSPVGGKLVLALAPTPLIDDHYMKRKVRVVDVDSGKVLAQLNNPGKLGEIVWSPDGEHLGFISAADLHDPSEGRLIVAPSAGSPLRDLLPDYQGHVRSIAWKDNGTVLYIGDEGCETVFGRVNIDGSDQHTIILAGGPILTGLSVSKDGQGYAFVGSSATHAREVFALKDGEAGVRRLTDSNPWLADRQLAKQEVIRYKARDGLELEGVLIHPLDEKPGRRYPLIVTVHGGPEANQHNGWLTSYSLPGQVAAARGFAVFYPNYRGSTGRGVVFSKMDQADYAGAEFNDLVDGVEHLVKMSLVDRDRVGVTGGSYGGYASAWCATALTEHFAASVMFVGISEQISKFGTTDIANEMYLVHARRLPWEGHWDWFRQRSPVYHTLKARTPILILGGKDDTRVYPGQSMQLYRYLKTIGEVPVRLIRYPGEGHGNRKAAARLDYNLRMLRWMEHYLQKDKRNSRAPAYEINYDLPKKDKDEDAEGHRLPF